jgi:hypothetical protein
MVAISNKLGMALWLAGDGYCRTEKARVVPGYPGLF